MKRIAPLLALGFTALAACAAEVDEEEVNDAIAMPADAFVGEFAATAMPADVEDLSLDATNRFRAALKIPDVPCGNPCAKRIEGAWKIAERGGKRHLELEIDAPRRTLDYTITKASKNLVTLSLGKSVTALRRLPCPTLMPACVGTIGKDRFGCPTKVCSEERCGDAPCKGGETCCTACNLCVKDASMCSQLACR